MVCPKCGSDQLRIANTRQFPDTVTRARHCMVCGYIFHTAEVVIAKRRWEHNDKKRNPNQVP